MLWDIKRIIYVICRCQCQLVDADKFYETLLKYRYKKKYVWQKVKKLPLAVKKEIMQLLRMKNADDASAVERKGHNR
jgi:hypothetical protein